MQKSGIRFLALPVAVFSSLVSLGLSFSPMAVAAEADETAPASSLQRLASMFSPQIQQTLNACWDRGKVNVAAGATPEGSVLCGDGTPEQAVPFNEYVNTVSDLLAASGLVGFRTIVESDPRISPAMLMSFLSNSEGTGMLRQTIQSAITQSQLLPAEATASNEILTNQVMDRLMPNLQNPDNLSGLLGTTEQYDQVVNSFCTAPGMSVSEARALVPDLNTLQLYSICIQESGVTNAALDMVR